MADIHEILLHCRIRNKLAFGEHFDLLDSENVKGAFWFQPAPVEFDKLVLVNVSFSLPNEDPEYLNTLL